MYLTINSIMIMRKIIILFAITLCLASMISCQGGKSDSVLSSEQIEQKTTYIDTLDSFFGVPLALNDSIHEQIAAIAVKNDMLTYEDSILQIADVKWGINTSSHGIILMSSISPESPKVKSVIAFLNKIYGKPYDDFTDEDWPEGKWSSSTDPSSPIQGTLVHLRPGRGGSGGMCLMFN